MGPRDPSDIYPFNWLDLMPTAAWAPPNLPPFQPLAPAPTDAQVAASAPAVGTPPWLQPLHEIKRAADTLSPSRPDPSSPDDIAGSLWTSNGSSAPGARSAVSPYTGAAAANPYLGSSTAGDVLDPARTGRLLERAKRDYDFVRWLSGVPGVRSAQPMQYVAPAADAPRSGAPMTGIDDEVDQPAPFNRPPPSSPPWLPLLAAPRRPQGSYWSLLSPSGELLTAGDLGAVNNPPSTSTWPRVSNSHVSFTGHPVYPPQPPAAPARPSPPIAALEDAGLPQPTVPPQPPPAAPSAADAPLTNNASWDPRTWTAYDNPLAWLQLDYERKFPTEAARLKRMPMGGDLPALNAPNAARRMGEAFATGYGDQPIVPTQDPGSITKAGSVTIPEWARPHVIALMRAGNSLPQALDQVLRAGRGALAMVPAAGAGVAQDLGIADQQGADKLQGELGIFMQFPGEPGAPSLAAAPRVVPETVGQGVLRRAEERPPTTPATSPPPYVGPSHIADFRARYNVPTTDTIAVGRTNVPGLEDLPFEGASPAVRQEAGLPPTIPGEIQSPSQIPRDRKHAEEDLFNQFIRKVEERRLRSSDLEGKLVIHVSNPNGVCSVCRWGLDNPDVRAGVIKQFSKLHPKLTIEFSVGTQPGIKTIGPSRFTIRDGAYVRRSDR